MNKIVKSIISFVAVAGMIVLGLMYFSDLTERKTVLKNLVNFTRQKI